MKIYLVRHGEIDKNREHVIVGQSENYQLNENGVRQANMLKMKISNIKFDACFTSPLIRAWSTAMILVGDRVEIKSDPRIMERYLGELEGKELELYDIDKYYDYKLNSNDKKVEPIQDLYTRCNDFINYLKDNYPKDSNILVVTHYGIVKTMHHILSNSKLDGILSEIKVENCCFRQYEI